MWIPEQNISRIVPVFLAYYAPRSRSIGIKPPRSDWYRGLPVQIGAPSCFHLRQNLAAIHEPRKPTSRSMRHVLAIPLLNPLQNPGLDLITSVSLMNRMKFSSSFVHAIAQQRKNLLTSSLATAKVPKPIVIKLGIHLCQVAHAPEHPLILRGIHRRPF